MMFGYLFFIFFALFPFSQEVSVDPINYLEISVELINRLENKESVSDLVDALAASTQDDIYKQIQTDDQKYAFWINIYNAYIQIILRDFPDAYDDRKSFFKKPQIEIAGRTYSFAEIEHGILRRSQMGLFLGYVTNPFPPKHERRLRVEERDYRIHFVLNCGAKSCPPIAVYHVDNLDYELDFMSQKYLEDTTIYNEAERTYLVTALFSWFRGDFDGSSGIREILYKHEVAANIETLKTLPYDWTLDLGNFRTIPSD
jgi:hypothetical protein